MRVRDVDVQCVLQFTLVNAAGCALHRRTSRVIHRLELSLYDDFVTRHRLRLLLRPCSSNVVFNTSLFISSLMVQLINKPLGQHKNVCGLFGEMGCCTGLYFSPLESVITTAVRITPNGQ